MVKERVYSLKQSVIDTAFAVANIAEYRRSVAIDLINTLDRRNSCWLVCAQLTPTRFPPLSCWMWCLSDFPVTILPSVKEFEKNFCADIMQVVKYRHVKNTGFISFDGKTFVLLPLSGNSQS
ncbi:hypothetical protein ACLK18_04865 [Escherichia coli]